MDTVDRATRSRNMAAVRSKNTSPERTVRSALHGLGYRFRLHQRDLPGNPDIVFPGRRKVVFVHGCFWHSHVGCARSRRPTTNADFWNRKIDRNVERDEAAYAKLAATGWEMSIVWECELRQGEWQTRLTQFLGEPGGEGTKVQGTKNPRKAQGPRFKKEHGCPTVGG